MIIDINDPPPEKLAALRAALRTLVGAYTEADVDVIAGDLQSQIAELAGGITAFGHSLINDIDQAAARSTLGLTPGTHVQAQSAVLAAIAALAPIADKIAFFTSDSTASLTDFAAKGRDIAAATDMSALLAKLGPVIGGPSPVPSAAGTGLSDGNFDTIVKAGLYSITGNWTNGQAGAGSTAYTGFLVVMARNTNTYYQTHYLVNGQIWMRYANGGGWSAWWRIDKPEYASVAGGEYVKFNDGTLICWYTDATGLDVNSATASVYTSSTTGTWTYPATFAATPVVFAAPVSVNRWGSCSAGLSSASHKAFAANASATAAAVKLMAIGRY